MCKHVAAVLYGIGARLDQQPELLFSLRQVDAKDLVAQAGAGLSKTKKIPTSKRVLEETSLAVAAGAKAHIDDAVYGFTGCPLKQQILMGAIQKQTGLYGQFV
jgi:uncharacterized Zn finger protein